MTSIASVPIAKGLFHVTSDGPRLIGGRCRSCGTHYFPIRLGCKSPGCGSRDIENIDLAARGQLWSFSVQHYPPPAPFETDGEFRPFAIGLVELPEGLKVMAMVEADDPYALAIGMDMELVLARLRTDGNGADVVTWKFRPAPNQP